MTFGGLFLAFWSLALVDQGHFQSAVWAIFGAGLMDTFDGASARALGVISPLGRQLDSLADLVAAGVAPALLVYRVYFQRWGAWGVLAGFAWVAFVAVRLARFTTSSSGDRLFFVGVPCPIAAAVLTQYLVFSRATWHNDGRPWVVIALIAGLGGLMLSAVPFWKTTALMPSEYFRHPFGPATTLVFLLLIPFPDQAIFVGTLVAVIGATVIHVASFPARRTLRTEHIT